MLYHLVRLNTTPQEDVMDTIQSVNTTALLNLAQGSLSGYHFTWADFSGATIDAAILIQCFLTAQSAFYLFDYLYRAFLTVRLVARFWGRGVVKLPRSDLRSRKPEIASAWFTWTQRLLRLLPFLSLQLLLLAVFVVFVIWGFAGKTLSFRCHEFATATLWTGLRASRGAYTVLVSW
jgi:hypothetical protein